MTASSATFLATLADVIASANPALVEKLESELAAWRNSYPVSVHGVRKQPFADRVLKSIDKGIADVMADRDDA